MKTAKKYLFIFDFDHTIVQDNTDTYIVNCLPNKTLPQEVLDLQEQSWNKHMQEVLKYIKNQNIPIEQMQNCLRTMKLTVGFDKIFDFLCQRKEQIDCVIVSDSNSFFIETILEANNAKQLFKKILTNPAQINENEQAVTMQPFHSHKCETCQANLCKREALRQNIDWEQGDGKQVCYFGDGTNDFCPLKLLGKNDIVFAREGYSLNKILVKKPVECQKFLWKDGNDILNSQYFRNIDI